MIHWLSDERNAWLKGSLQVGRRLLWERMCNDQHELGAIGITVEWDGDVADVNEGLEIL